MKKKFNKRNIACDHKHNLSTRKKIYGKTDSNQKSRNPYQNIKFNTKKMINNHSSIIKIKKEFDVKENFEIKYWNDPILNLVVKKSFEKDKNRKKAHALIKKIMDVTASHEKDGMRDFLKNILTAKKLSQPETHKINKNNAKSKYTKAPKTKNDKPTER